MFMNVWFIHNTFFWIEFTNHNSITQSNGIATDEIPIKNPPTYVRGKVLPSSDISANSRCVKCNRSGLSSSEVQGEVVSVALVHDFHTQVCSVKNVCPGVKNSTLTIKDGLVEVETVEVERHRGYTKCGEPDANNRPCSKEEVQ